MSRVADAMLLSLGYNYIFWSGVLISSMVIEIFELKSV